MSILINGMDMPELYENEEHLWVPGWIEVDKDGKAIFCTGTHFDPNTIRSYPIEEVSTPHGRLIDADRLLEPGRTIKPLGGEEILFADTIRYAPTIIEAEG